MLFEFDEYVQSMRLVAFCYLKHLIHEDGVHMNALQILLSKWCLSHPIQPKLHSLYNLGMDINRFHQIRGWGSLTLNQKVGKPYYGILETNLDSEKLWTSFASKTLWPYGNAFSMLWKN